MFKTAAEKEIINYLRVISANLNILIEATNRNSMKPPYIDISDLLGVYARTVMKDVFEGASKKDKNRFKKLMKK